MDDRLGAQPSQHQYARLVVFFGHRNLWPPSTRSISFKTRRLGILSADVNLGVITAASLHTLLQPDLDALTMGWNIVYGKLDVEIKVLCGAFRSTDPLYSEQDVVSRPVDRGWGWRLLLAFVPCISKDPAGTTIDPPCASTKRPMWTMARRRRAGMWGIKDV